MNAAKSVEAGAATPAASDIENRIGLERVAPAPFRENLTGWLTLAVVWAASAGYMAAHLREGWVPFDAGQLAQMAERVLRGQVPYRDFIENYTGGLTYMNALAFRVFGTNLFSLRIPLFLFFLGWVPSVYFIARRFVGPISAGAVSLLSVAWSVPNYPEAMPSWYNLFFATWGVLALLRFTETKKRRWLWAAGACGGLSILFKIVGLYFVAAALLFFVFQEASRPRRATNGITLGSLPLKIFASVGLLLFLTTLTELVLERPTGSNFFYFVLPSTCLVILLLGKVWSSSPQGTWLPVRRLVSVILPFLGGVLTPIALFLAYYIRIGAAKGWFLGVLGSSAHVIWAATGAPSPLLAIGILPLAVGLVIAYRRGPGSGSWAGIGVTLASVAGLVAASRSLIVYTVIGLSLFALVPALALAAAFWLFRARPPREDSQQRVFLLVAVAVLCSLVQFPFPFPLFFCYVAPLAALALVGLLSTLDKRANNLVLGSLIVFYLVFAVWLRTPGFTSSNGFVPDQPYSLSRLKGSRTGGLLVNKVEAMEYRRLIPLVKQHAHGQYIYAGPDAPEIYFLTGLRNPTGTIFDFLDPDFLDVSERNERILSAINDHGVNVVALREGPSERNPAYQQTAAQASRKNELHLVVISGPLSAGLITSLDSEFPKSERVGDFDVRWK